VAPTVLDPRGCVAVTVCAGPWRAKCWPRQGSRSTPGDTHEKTVAAVHAALAALSTYGLLIFDNAPGPGIGAGVHATRRASADHDAEPALGARTGSERPGPGCCRCGRVPGRPPGDPDPAAAKLAAEVGELALERAAEYMQATGAPSRIPGPVPGPTDRPAGSRPSPRSPSDVAATLGPAMTRLGRDAPAVAGASERAGVAGPESLPL
jgi:hypothetical protein